MKNRKELLKFIDVCKKNNLRVFVPDKEDYTYCHFTDGKNIAYAECDYFGGINISSVHKRNIKTGSGYRIFTMTPEPTYVMAKAALNVQHNSPKYKDWEEYAADKLNSLLGLIEV